LPFLGPLEALRGAAVGLQFDLLRFFFFAILLFLTLNAETHGPNPQRKTVFSYCVFRGFCVDRSLHLVAGRRRGGLRFSPTAALRGAGVRMVCI